MGRPLFPLLCLASALLCVGVTVLWWHSARTIDVLTAPRSAGDHWLISSEFGVVVFEHQQLQPMAPGDPQPGWVFFSDVLPRQFPGHWQWLGFDAYRGQSKHYRLLPPAMTSGVVVPHWFIVLLLAILPAMWLRQAHVLKIIRNRRAAGLCTHCGYDLRASPGRCPECGAEIVGLQPGVA
jgi:hypothetical protein